LKQVLKTLTGQIGKKSNFKSDHMNPQYLPNWKKTYLALFVIRQYYQSPKESVQNRNVRCGERHKRKTYDAQPQLCWGRVFFHQGDQHGSYEWKTTEDQINHLVFACAVHHISIFQLSETQDTNATGNFTLQT
jgi:hypothetical protein